MFLNVKNRRKDKPSQKLNHKYWRFFLIEEKTTNNTYKLRLLSFMKIHSVFNTDRLKSYYKDVSTKQETYLKVVKEIEE